jgi:uncharacterized protein YxjI
MMAVFFTKYKISVIIWVVIPKKGVVSYMKHFYLKQKVFSLTDRYKIFDETQQELYEVRSKMFSLTNKMELSRISDGTVLFHFQKQLFHLMPTYHLMDGNHESIATVKKQFTLLSKKVNVEANDATYHVEGDFTGHQFSIIKDGSEVANLKKKWISWGDTYEITIYEDHQAEFMLSLVILIDSMFHEENKRRH